LLAGTRRTYQASVPLVNSQPPRAAPRVPVTGGEGGPALAARLGRQGRREKSDRKDGSRGDRRTIRKAPYVVNLTCGESGPRYGLARAGSDRYMARTPCASGDGCLS